ncbi:GNAT family N-acetyltransferase [Patescibacteria group bacterium]|nr:GNAT family N-acetyltransferase [Patescibacteria group bacterium]
MMVSLQQHIADIDPLKRNRQAVDFDAALYVETLLKRVERENVVILVASEEDIPMGFIAGTIPEQDENDLLDHYPTREGTILELIVSTEQRGKSIGRQLMEELENHFRQHGCGSVRVGCFAPNTGAHGFYEKCGYDDRYIEMLKKLD